MCNSADPHRDRTPRLSVQVRECATALLHVAKQNDIPVFLVGHVTKSGDIAGPRVLEHIVDVVLYMEGEKHQAYRLLRGIKNRHGATDEVGLIWIAELQDRCWVLLLSRTWLLLCGISILEHAAACSLA